MGKVEDLTNRKFGKLLVLKDTKTKNKHRAEIWKCKCDCGNIVLKSSEYLKTTKRPYCGKCKLDKVRSYNFKDLTNQKFNNLLVLELYSTDKSTIWKCQCDCGNITYVAGGHLKDGHTKSCGCLKGEIRNGHFFQGLSGEKNPSYKHGLTHTKLYETWSNMKTRCYNQKGRRYKDYGGRKIKVCEEWKNDFISFYNWAIANGYKENLTLDRINVNGNYEPSNCRWVDWKKQQNNRRNNFIIEYNKTKHTLQEWSEILPINISSSILRYRILSGWSIEEAFSTPVDRRKNRWEK